MDKRRSNLRILAYPGTFLSSSVQSEGDPLFLRPAIPQLNWGGKLLEMFRAMTQSTVSRLLLVVYGQRNYGTVILVVLGGILISEFSLKWWLNSIENRRNCVIRTLGEESSVSLREEQRTRTTTPSAPATDATSRHVERKSSIFSTPFPIIETNPMSEVLKNFIFVEIAKFFPSR
ncbi:uncharacterized protein BDW43DRAFT_4442 [Aspergillus alliaceus]|uniref:uncharacterized protein n=1 Tax=Petromyces alliaceus TaxID=209559 RepID=UPI0012A76C7E|nr:uncharacterized protein BDW43DRAFT_4442 [Aspergillus alliaceus]KAB8239435.1 hypothetical protein BDW43DRAFT_4442 [Aspergillus alliaceus]